MRKRMGAIRKVNTEVKKKSKTRSKAWREMLEQGDAPERSPWISSFYAE